MAPLAIFGRKQVVGNHRILSNILPDFFPTAEPQTLPPPAEALVRPLLIVDDVGATSVSLCWTVLGLKSTHSVEAYTLQMASTNCFGTFRVMF